MRMKKELRDCSDNRKGIIRTIGISWTGEELHRCSKVRQFEKEVVFSKTNQSGKVTPVSASTNPSKCPSEPKQSNASTNQLPIQFLPLVNHHNSTNTLREIVKLTRTNNTKHSNSLKDSSNLKEHSRCSRTTRATSNHRSTKTNILSHITIISSNHSRETIATCLNRSKSYS